MQNNKVRYRLLDFMADPGYRVGTDGSVWTRLSFRGRGPGGGKGVVSYLGPTWKRMKETLMDSRGYRVVGLKTNGNIRNVGIHRLVLFAFVGPPPKGYQACHFPVRDPSNNKLSNLKWGTVKENHSHKKQHGTEVKHEKHGMSKTTMLHVQKIRLLRAENKRVWTIRALAREFQISPSQICRIVNGRSWK